jgi:hypothetical protein
VWDLNELYDLEQDPLEVNNLIRNPAHQETAQKLSKELWDWLAQTDGLQIPLKPRDRKKSDHLYQGTW